MYKYESLTVGKDMVLLLPPEVRILESRKTRGTRLFHLHIDVDTGST